MLSSNHAWAYYKAHQNPNIFLEHARGEAPQIRTSQEALVRSVQDGFILTRLADRKRPQKYGLVALTLSAPRQPS